MLDVLHSQFKFDFALFSPNIATHFNDLKGIVHKSIIIHNNNIKFKLFFLDTTLTTKPLNKCLNHSNYWNELQRNVILSSNLNNQNHSKVFTCVNEVFDYINLTYKTDEKIDLLVTGSLYLVGATLLAIKKNNVFK